MEEVLKKLLERQQYGMIGNNSAVKLCTWLKKSLRDQGVCYKEKFYGIKSHKCCQMTPDVNFCQNSCVFCWRNLEGTERTMDKIIIDEPSLIIEESIKKQKKLMSGFGGYDQVNRKKLKEAQEPMHFAISLAGEPTLYPKLAELIKELHKKGKTTFLVTNGLLPEKLEELEKKKSLPTQLYVSLDAPNKELFFKIDRCTIKDGWERLMKTLDVLKKLRHKEQIKNKTENKTRTCLRITLIKEINDVHPEKYAELIKKSDAMFVEVKSYMYVGSSRERLEMKNMPLHEDIIEFANKIGKYCGYKIIDEQIPSRVVLMMKEDFDERIMKF